MAERTFAEVCEGASKILKVLADQAKDCGDTVRFDRKAFQPNIAMLAEVLTAFGKVQLEDF